MSRFRRAFVVTSLASVFVAACGWDPRRPFEREAPEVNEAIQSYSADAALPAAQLLEEYLTTGQCKEGNIGTPNRVRERPNGSFDLGLSLFKLAEQFGHRFGDEENDAGFMDPNLKTQRSESIDCALRIVRAVAEDPSQPVALRARARYLEGNILFLGASYKEAVTAYDHALELAPGMADSGPIGASDAAIFDPDPVGRDAAWNRAIALRRIEDKKDAGSDGGGGDGGNNQGDGGNDKNNDGGSDDPDGGKNDDNKDGGKDSGGGNDDKKDGGDDKDKKDPPKPDKDPNQQSPDAGPQPPPPETRQNQDERILDQLENAPTVQQEAARKLGRRRKVPGMADK